MKKNLRLALLGVCALAGVALVVEFAVPILGLSSDPSGGSHITSQRLTAKRADTLVAEILKRPLFTPGRQPPQLRVARAEPPVLQSRLAGVMLQPDAREALFSRPNARPVTVREGDVIDGWTVKKIEEDSVILTSAFGEQVVKPTNGGAGEVRVPMPRQDKRGLPVPPGAEETSPVLPKRAAADLSPQRVAQSEWPSR